MIQDLKFQKYKYKSFDELKKSGIKFYECFAPNLLDFLLENGVEIIYGYRHSDRLTKCKVFELTDEFSELLKAWTEHKKQNALSNESK